jgi:uncharacterized protein (DUF302 family)
MAQNSVTIIHEQLILKTSYEAFTARLENVVLKKLNVQWYDLLEKDPAAFEAHINETAGTVGLILFGFQQHGRLLNIIGKPRSAKQYIIGNPLTATRMTRHDIRAGIYAPLRLFVYENTDGQLVAEYDLPSSLFGQFGNEQVTAVARELDQKLLNVIHLADTL